MTDIKLKKDSAASIPDAPRLLFREFTPDDYADAASVLLDDEIMKKMSPVVSKELVRRWLARRLEQYRTLGHSHWHVSLKESGEFAGIIGIVPEKIEDAEHIALGYLICREHQRNGYAYEGSKACLDWAFHTLDTDEIVAEIDEDNLPSRLLAEKLGFVCERIYPRFNGESNVPYCLYKLSRNHFCSGSKIDSY